MEQGYLHLSDNDKAVALVTGASVRIGQAIALELGASGYIVAVHYRGSDTAAQKTAKAIEESGGRAHCFAADLADENAVDAMMEGITADLGPVTCLINNASHFENDDIETMSRQTWDAHIEPNLRAPLRLVQLMAENIGDRNGNVINLIDQRVLKLTPQFLSYTVSKSALWTLTRTLAQALAPAIRVNAIAPGPTLKNQRQSDEHFDRQVAATPLGRAATLEEVRATVRFILQTPSLTGQMITLDGGQHLNWQTPDVTDIVE